MQDLENPGMTPVPAERFKRALKGFVSAALRLHHYRFVRTRMLQDALSAARADTGTGVSPASVRPGNAPGNME
jgi:hypothetical protein